MQELKECQFGRIPPDGHKPYETIIGHVFGKNILTEITVGLKRFHAGLY